MSDDENTAPPTRKRNAAIDYRRQPHAEVVRDRIRASGVINRLMKHVFGKLEMSATQVRAAEILLKKVVPDLKQVEHTGSIEHRHVTELTDEQLTTIAAGRSSGIVDEAPVPALPAPVH